MKFDQADLHDKVLNAEARRANEEEHQVTLWQGLKTYKKAALWSLVISTSVIMEGYDTTLMGSFMGYPAFRDKYGVPSGNDKDGNQIPASWQTALNDIGGAGNFIGAMLNGWMTAKWGHRKVIMFWLAFLTASIFLVFFAPDRPVLLVGQFLCSIPFGVFATTGPAYAAEVVPLALRGYLTAYINLCWCIGQLISAGVLIGLVNNPTQWSYRVPFAVQWVWPIPLFIAAYFAPESPWFLVRKGELAKAKKSLQRLSEPSHNLDYNAALGLMVHTNKLEEQEREGVTYWDAFRGTNRRRTEIACMTFVSQVTYGGALCYSGSFFFEQTGIDAHTSYAISLGGTGIAFICTCISWLYISKWGRRNIWLCGMSFLTLDLLIIGCLACAPQTLSLAWAQSILCVVWLGASSMSVGPIVYTIVSEIGSTRLRTQTVVLGRSSYYIANIIGGVMEPYFMSPTAWNAQGKTAFWWFSTALLTTLWGYFRLPETKDRTFDELDVLFQKKIPARKFSTYEINADEEFLAH
ncbi:general substrate transporter [Xylariales sp. PMI_506]|nr:general substrate transporter [Xylariales sp. PMI_506]